MLAPGGHHRRLWPGPGSGALLRALEVRLHLDCDTVGRGSTRLNSIFLPYAGLQVLRAYSLLLIRLVIAATSFFDLKQYI